MPGHYLILPRGDVLKPDGYSVGLSRAVMAQIVGLSPEYAARTVSVLKRYLNHKLVTGEDPERVENEPCEEATTRVTSFFVAQGIPVVPSKHAKHRDELRLMVPEDRSTAHAQQIVSILRQFYQLLGEYRIGARDAANPLELPGWHLVEARDRLRDWLARHPERPAGWLQGGLRFKVYKRKPYLPLIEDPTGCGRAMTLAVIAYGAPQSVVDVCLVLEENGCRWRETAWANALGWSIRGFGEQVFTTNKFDDEEHAKKITLPPDVLSRLIRRFEGMPHPVRPDATMMDYLQERAKVGDEDALRSVPLFVNSRGTRHKHSTFNGHWFRPAMAAWGNLDGSRGLKVQSDVSARQPTLHWYRHAVISGAIEAALEGSMSEAEILEVSRRVCRSFSLKTDQAKRYAAALMRRLADEEQMRRVAARREANEAKRRGCGVAVHLPRLELSESERLLRLLPQRAGAVA